MAKVSVIIPIYNIEKYLRECLNSLINQTIKDIEVICVDNNSTDSSLQILKEFAERDERIKVYNQPIQGSAYARNLGLKHATGEYIGFVDGDDYIDNNYYEILYNIAISKKADIAATKSVKLFGNNIDKIKNMGIKSCSIKSFKDKSKIITTTGVNCNKIFKREFVSKFDINFPEVDSTGQDNYFNALAVIFANKIISTDKVTYYYRQFEQAATKKTKTKKHFQIVEIYRQIDERIKSSKHLSLFEKNRWLKTINKRKMKDISLHYNMMHKDFKSEFIKLINKTFPELNFPKPIDNLIVSLTSYPARINTVNQTIESILNQTLHPDKLILVLASEQFPNKEDDLPEQLLTLKDRGLEIDWYHDIKSFKKLVPVLQKYHDNIIVTADDDALYHFDWLQTLYNNYLKHPNQIHCHRAHRVMFDKNTQQILPYCNWYKRINTLKPSFNNFFTGLGGVLYPPNCFYKDILKEELFTKLCPHADDIWFWAMAVLNNTSINIVKNCQSNLTSIEGTQEGECLWKTNVNENKNDEQLKNVLEYYPKILDKLDKRKFNPVHYSFFEQIFSIKNSKSFNKKWYKVICFLGIKFSVRNKRKEKRIAEEQEKKNLAKILKNLEQQNDELKNELNTQQENTKRQIDELKNEIKIQQENYQKQNNKLQMELTYIKEWQVNYNMLIPNKFPIELLDAEKNLLIKYFRQSSNYLEFGAGGSTFLALINADLNIYSIESDYNWIEYLRTYKIISKAEFNKKLFFRHIDIGKTKDWGYPLDDSKSENYPMYSTEIFKQINPDDIDMVFVDGRFRVACAIATILNCNPNTCIIMHDYTIREHYHIVEEFLDVVETQDTLVVFKIKQNISIDRLKEVYEEYKYVKD